MTMCAICAQLLSTSQMNSDQPPPAFDVLVTPPAESEPVLSSTPAASLAPSQHPAVDAPSMHTSSPSTRLEVHRPKGLGKKASSSFMDDENSSLTVAYDQLSWTVQIANPSTDKAEVKKNPKVPKQVLQNVSGVFRANRFTAVMGSSGAGERCWHSASYSTCSN
jgi:hypothetical protein